MLKISTVLILVYLIYPGICAKGTPHGEKEKHTTITESVNNDDSSKSQDPSNMSKDSMVNNYDDMKAEEVTKMEEEMPDLMAIMNECNATYNIDMSKFIQTYR
jgi:hypothetical protein